MFSVNFKNIVNQNLPPKTGADVPITKSWLYSLIQPIIELYAIFSSYRIQALYMLSFTGQVIYLEKLLNDTFNNGGTGIFIEDGGKIAPFIFNTEENEPDLFIYNTEENEPDFFIYNTEEYPGNVDFIVKVPTALVFDDNHMKSLINKYKLAGKNYTIQTY